MRVSVACDPRPRVIVGTCRNVQFRQQHATMDSAPTNSSLALLLAGMAGSDQ